VIWKNADGKSKSIKSEIEAVKRFKLTEKPNRILTIAFRQLVTNAEEKQADFFWVKQLFTALQPQPCKM
jgi:hypothetical protein